jgi:threonylcarbamoyladenosine tRNA methylthiotransferase MtaB
MVGFPGEDEAAFERSCELVASFPFVNVHVFSFSARPRTSAFAMGGRVSPADMRRRSDRLHRLALACRHEVYASQVGRELRVLFETRAEDGSFVGYSDHYVKVAVSAREDLANRFGRVVVTGVDLSADGDHVRARGELVAREPCAAVATGA